MTASTATKSGSMLLNSRSMPLIGIVSPEFPQKKVTAYLSNKWKEDLLRAFDQLISINKIPVSRSL